MTKMNVNESTHTTMETNTRWATRALVQTVVASKRGVGTAGGGGGGGQTDRHTDTK